MNAVEDAVPSPNSTVDALDTAQRNVVCEAFEKDKALRPINRDIYMNAKETHRMAHMLHTAERLQCGFSSDRQALANALRTLLLRFR
ncbi:hypothetical protein CYMTET_43116 [Cymbomonas tetramitiformis]|uniref:Uncharacterized protein n=1 Tax=Cymbomonas tetramitiformis TaxID=36881 RepID=A0AAE0C2T6_9CHLO|nr:hypothetical protein CYMTET_43119 [Cymbomonas tetramitiformis]KAK3247393.1 hypothetical protein CYMTET_43116 [Cymbomonas tetramitiformis]